ncbi:ABC transporter permease [Mycoplasmatota bacterium]|nr:ABC transporter permease [Mycoplasmatota bacterium]
MTAYDIELIKDGLLETLYMIFISTLFILVFGLIIGFILYFTHPDQTTNKYLRLLNQILSAIVNIFRSIPFVILIVIMIPVTLILTNGQMLGSNGALPPLIVSATPFYARIVYNALLDIPKGRAEALLALGASNLKITSTLFREALPSLLSGLTVTIITLIGFISAANAIGGGGLSDQAVIFLIHNGSSKQLAGYISVAIILLIVFMIQISSDLLIKKINHK